MKDRRGAPWTKVQVVSLYDNEVERLVDLLTEYREGVAGGSISGFGQSREDELDDVDLLIKKIKS